MRLFVAAAIILCSAELCSGYSLNDDEIKSLPGVSFEVNFKQYSGFLNASSTRFVHYWFVESQSNSSLDPLLVWFASPGFSTLTDLLKGFGPFRVNPDGRTLGRNPYAWNKFPNILFLDAPAGTGYSYSTDLDYTNDDRQAATEIVDVLKQFFAQHPTFRNQSVFFGGRDYAVHLCAHVALRIIREKWPLKIEGIIGDHAYVDASTAINGMYRYGYARGLIPEEPWKEIVDVCCDDICMDACDLFTVESQDCANKLIKLLATWIGVYHLDVADLTRSCRMKRTWRWERRLGQAPLCANDTDIETYINLPEVCQALHVPRNNCGDWKVDDTHVYEWYQDSLTATQAVLQALRFHVRVLVYYGDNALLTNVAGGRRWAYGQGLENTVDNVPWHYKGTLAGFHSVFARGNLTYATLCGVGMQARRQRPQQTKHLVRQFLKNQPL